MKNFRTLIVMLLLAVTIGLIQCFLLIRSRAASHASRGKQNTRSSQTTRERGRLSKPVALHAAGRGRPLMNLDDGHDLLTDYVGTNQTQTDSLRYAFQSGGARPLALASGDFDEDGVPDLLSAFTGSAGVPPASGFIILHRGNVDSIYPNTHEAEERKARGEFTDAPFLSPAIIFQVPTEPDFIGAGDFDADGHLDLVMAARGGNQLYWMRGDGHGGFGSTQVIELPGRVAAMTVGEINRRDGLADVVIGIDRSANAGSAGVPPAVDEGAGGTPAYPAQLLVFEGPEGALKHEPETIALPAPATSLALGRLDDSYEMDLAVAAGNDLVIVHGRDRKLSIDEEERSKVAPPEVETQEIPFTLSSIAIGNFTRNDHEQIAALSDDGVIHVIERSAKQAWGKVTADIATPLHPAGVSPDAAKTNPTLVKARVSVSGFDDVVVVDSANRQLHVVSNGVRSTAFS